MYPIYTIYAIYMQFELVFAEMVINYKTHGDLSIYIQYLQYIQYKQYIYNIIYEQLSTEDTKSAKILFLEKRDQRDHLVSW